MTVVTEKQIEAGRSAIQSCRAHGTSDDKMAAEVWRAMKAKEPLPHEVDVERAARALARYRGNENWWRKHITEAATVLSAIGTKSEPASGDELDADSGMSGDAVVRAEWFWANLPTGNRTWTSLTTAEKALVCHTLARTTNTEPTVRVSDLLNDARLCIEAALAAYVFDDRTQQLLYETHERLMEATGQGSSNQIEGDG